MYTALYGVYGGLAGGVGGYALGQKAAPSINKARWAMKNRGLSQAAKDGLEDIKFNRAKRKFNKKHYQYGSEISRLRWEGQELRDAMFRKQHGRSLRPDERSVLDMIKVNGKHVAKDVDWFPPQIGK